METITDPPIVEPAVENNPKHEDLRRKAEQWIAENPRGYSIFLSKARIHVELGLRFSAKSLAEGFPHACAGDLRADLNDWWFAPRGEWSSGSQVERGGQWWIPTFPWLQGILPVMPARSSHPRCGAAGRLPLGSSLWWSTSALPGLGDLVKEDRDFISDLGLRLGVLVGVIGSMAMLALLLGCVVALWRWALSF